MSNGRFYLPRIPEQPEGLEKLIMEGKKREFINIIFSSICLKS
jgi:hypothetical protein